MSKQLVIQACKCVLVLSENDLFNGLNSEVLTAALRRGKSYKRKLACERREYQVGRWQIYEWLKGNKVPDNAALLIESMNVTELQKGVAEYIQQKERMKTHV